MTLRALVNRALRRTTGHEVRRPGSQARRLPPGAAAGDRLLEQPAFVLSSVRSGSTLVRVLLDSHSAIHAPPELHLRDLKVGVRTRYALRALDEIGLDRTSLRFLLWDRMLQRELARSGKRILVNKTPNDVFIADKIRQCWPDARFIFLLRHPQAIANSRGRARPQDAPERNIAKVLRYLDALEAARSRYDGLTVRYEDLAADPAAETRRICAFLGVDWEEDMLDYGRFDHGSFRPGLGDWKENIKSGKVQPPAPLPAPRDVAPALRPLAVAWGYLDAPTAPLARASTGSSSDSSGGPST
jgi:hypothetical protein